MEFWDEVKKDVQKGLKEGMSLVKAGASIAVKKVDELTQESKRRFQSFDMKTKVHNEVAELGARVYKLCRDGKLELADARAKGLVTRIRRLEAEIAGLGQPPAEAGPEARPKRRKPAAKKAAGRKTAPKKSTGKTAVKKTRRKTAATRKATPSG